jgi:formyltetrahydrofolate deformylase
MTSTTATLLVSCRDRTGLVAALSNFVFENGGNIVSADQHAEPTDPDGGGEGLFFMRLVWDTAGFRLDRAGIAAALKGLAVRFDLAWQLSYSDRRQRVVVLVSKTPHCLYDLLLRQQLGELDGDIVGVISNHDDLRGVAEHFAIPYWCLPVAADGKGAAEAAQQRRLDELGVDLVVLARYMQVLSPAFVARWPGRIINIHHSFLPAFVGAHPYRQAKERGVKIIGATAHYITADLDQGPIIEQDVARVSHRDQVDDLVRKGRDLERQVLSRAVRAHLDRRVLVVGNRTIVFA